MMRARRGMTLMELVIGLAITGMMATAGAVAFGSIIDHRQVIRTATVETERAAALQTVLRHDVAYMTDLREEIVAMRHAYVGSAVAEIASFRAQLAAPQVG